MLLTAWKASHAIARRMYIFGKEDMLHNKCFSFYLYLFPTNGTSNRLMIVLSFATASGIHEGLVISQWSKLFLSFKLRSQSLTFCEIEPLKPEYISHALKISIPISDPMLLYHQWCGAGLQTFSTYKPRSQLIRESLPNRFSSNLDLARSSILRS